jgi:hypothetical protein
MLLENTHVRFKRAGMGTNGILEVEILSRNESHAHVVAAVCVSDFVACVALGLP